MSLRLVSSRICEYFMILFLWEMTFCFSLLLEFIHIRRIHAIMLGSEREGTSETFFAAFLSGPPRHKKHWVKRFLGKSFDGFFVFNFFFWTTEKKLDDDV